MNPWDITAWVGAIAASAVIATLAIIIVTAAIRSLRNKDRTRRVI